MPETTSVEGQSTINNTDFVSPVKKPIKGKRINLKNLPAPKIVLAGKPRIVPLKNNHHYAGKFKFAKIPKKLKIVEPGLDSIPSPEIFSVKLRKCRFVYPEQVKAQPPRFKDEATCNIQYLCKEQGYSGIKTEGIIHDEHQNIWFATNGLIRYDGTYFTRFSKVISDEEIYTLNIASIIKNIKGDVWFVTRGKNGHIFKFDGNTVTEYSIVNNKNKLEINSLNSILEDKNGNIWFGSKSSGVYKFEAETPGFPEGRFIHFSKKQGLPSDSINSITEDINGNIWFGTNGAGLCKYEVSSSDFPHGRFIYYSSSEGLSNNNITSITNDRNGNLLIGTYGGGVNIFDGENFVYITTKDGLSSNFIIDIIEDKNGDFWFATFGGGVCKYEKKSSESSNGQFIHYTISKNLASNHILSITEDNRGNLWFGSVGNEIMIYKPNSFSHITPSMGMEYDFLVSPLEDNNGNIWFGEERGGGICKYNGKTFSYFTKKEGLCGDSVTSLIQDRDGNIWVGTSGGGICSYNGKSFTHFTEKNGLISNYITFLLEDKKGNIWIGTEKEGVIKYDGKSFFQFSMDEGLNGNYIEYILEDRNENLWISTRNGGIDKYDGEYITNYSSEVYLGHRKIRSIMEDKKGNIWFGSHFGAIKFDVNSDDITRGFSLFLKKGSSHENWPLSFNDILPDHRIKFLKEDKSENIWVGTEGGIFVLYLSDDYSDDKMQVETFGKQDGLKGDNPIINTAFIDNKNRLCYGYKRAFTILNLNTFKSSVKVPDIILNSIELEQNFIDFRELDQTKKDGEEFFIGANNNINLGKVKFTNVASYYNYPLNLELPYNLNHITFHFSAIDWQAPHKLQYQYMLKGSDQNWRPITAESKANYNNLSFGHYTFKVKAIGAANKWSNTFEYNFIVNPPWWYTWWAYLLYFIAFLSLIFVWRRYDLKQQRLKKELELEQLQTEKLEELDKMKSHFFANISHEFRTPLTLILGPLQNLISKTNDKKSKQELDIIQRNGRRLYRLINQLLNLSKIEAGKMKIQTREENIVSLSRLFVQSFESLAMQREITLKFNADENEILVYVDHEKIEKILNNILSNAFKSTEEGGYIEVTVTYLSPSKGVSISVSDTGHGIEPEKLPHIFDRFYQAEGNSTKKQEGTGIGLALTKELVELHHGDISVKSKPGQGTIIFIELPLGKSHLGEDEIIERKDKTIHQIIPNIIDSFDLPLDNKTHENKSDLNENTPIVLLVEDNADLRLYIRGFLEQKYNVLEASDGKDGLTKAIKTIPDLIISDVMMPNMDGYQLCNKLKTDERTSHIPLILLTARASMESKIEGLETGADDFITKPFEPQELKVRVKNLIEQRNKLKDRYKKEIGVEEHASTSTLRTIDQQFLDKAKKIVFKNISEAEFSVDDFAKELGISRVQLHRKLRALIDQSTSEFIRTLRLNRAAELLLQNGGNISEIAYDVGFNNPSYFTSSFSNQFGLSPKEYINRNSGSL